MKSTLIILIFIFTLPFYSYSQFEVKIENDTIFQSEFTFLILFDTNLYETDSLPMREFTRLRNALRVYPDGFVQLEARTDNRGSLEYNLRLATKRLEFVKNVLMKNEIDESRFLEFVFGKTNPLADNTHDEGRQKNRSVSISFQRIIPLTPLTGRIVCKESGKGIEGKVYVSKRPFQDSVKTNEKGEFTIPVPVTGEFAFEFHSSHHIIGRRNYELKTDGELLSNIQLQPLSEGMFFNFDDILFVGGQSIIRDEYRYTLPRLYKMLSAADSYRFEIQGHVHSPGKPMYEGTRLYSLSENRAMKIYNYLVHSGIEPERLEWKAYSNFRMRYPNPKFREQSRKNKRVTVQVLGRVER